MVITRAMMSERQTLIEEEERPWLMGVWVLHSACEPVLNAYILGVERKKKTI